MMALQDQPDDGTISMLQQLEKYIASNYNTGQPPGMGMQPEAEVPDPVQVGWESIPPVDQVPPPPVEQPGYFPDLGQEADQQWLDNLMKYLQEKDQ